MIVNRYSPEAKSNIVCHCLSLLYMILMLIACAEMAFLLIYNILNEMQFRHGDMREIAFVLFCAVILSFLSKNEGDYSMKIAFQIEQKTN